MNIAIHTASHGHVGGSETATSSGGEVALIILFVVIFWVIFMKILLSSYSAPREKTPEEINEQMKADLFEKIMTEK